MPVGSTAELSKFVFLSFSFSFHFCFCYRALARDGNSGGAKSPTPESATLPFCNLSNSGVGDFVFFNKVGNFKVGDFGVFPQ